MKKAAILACVATSIVFGAPASGQLDDTARVAVVVDISPAPLLDADGEKSKNSDRSLKELSRSLKELDGLDVPFTLSVSGLFVDELRLAVGARTYASLLGAAKRYGVLTTPYAETYLSQLDDASAVGAEIRAGSSALETALDVSPTRVLAPPGLALSDAAIDGMGAEKLSALLAPAARLGSQAVLDEGITLLPAVEMPDVALDLDDLSSYGELVLIEPATSGVADRVRAHAADESIQIVGIKDLLIDPVPAGASFGGIDKAVPDTHTVAYVRASDAVSAFDRYTQPDNVRGQLFHVLLARSRSSASHESWGQLTERADFLLDLVETERELIAASDGSVTLTSRRGTVPVTVINRARYEVRIRVNLSSPKLDFPDGASRVITVSPKGDTFTFVAEARSTGSFPMTVRLTSPDRRVEFAPAEVIVRSTAANVPALALTLGALVFLLLWSSRGVLLRRRQGVRGSSSADALRSPGKRDTTT